MHIRLRRHIRRALSFGVACFTLSATCFIVPATHAAEPGKETKFVVPALEVAIPGVNFTSDVSRNGEYYSIPYLAQYIAGGVRYLISVVALVAAIMIIYGGFKYVFSATVPGVQTGKERITDAVIGLIIVLASGTILAAFNADTAKMKPLQIKNVDQIELKSIFTMDEKTFNSMVASGNAKDPKLGEKLSKESMDTLINSLPKESYSEQQKKESEGDANCALNSPVPKPTGKQPFTTTCSNPGAGSQCYTEILDQVGIHPCFGIVTMAWEARTARDIGCDESASYSGSRTRFLKRGTTYTGKSLPALATPGSPSEAEMKDTTKFKNDDACANKTIGSPPLYGMDWDFGRGIGWTQVTIFPKEWCSSVPSLKFGGECLNMEQLLDPKRNLQIGSVLLYAKGAPPKESRNFNLIRAVWYRYAGSGSAANKISFARTVDTLDCMKMMDDGEKNVGTILGKLRRTGNMPKSTVPFCTGYGSVPGAPTR